MSKWHNVTVKYHQDVYQTQLSWCRQRYGSKQSRWDIDWSQIVDHNRDVVVKFKFRDQSIAVEFELIYG